MSYPNLPVAAEPPIEWPHYKVGFAGAIKRGFVKWNRMSGRAGRAEYWWWQLFVALGVYLPFILGLLIGVAAPGSALVSPGDSESPPLFIPLTVVSLLFMLAIIVPSFTLLARRLHDVNMSALFLLIGLFPYLGGFVLFIFTLIGTSPAAGRFGPPYEQPSYLTPGHPQFGGYPYAGYPQQVGYPQPHYPQPHYPQADDQSGYPQYGPQPGSPPDPYAQQPYPQQSYPQQPYPQQPYPQSGGEQSGWTQANPWSDPTSDQLRPGGDQR